MTNSRVFAESGELGRKSFHASDDEVKKISSRIALKSHNRNSFSVRDRDAFDEIRGNSGMSRSHSNHSIDNVESCLREEMDAVLSNEPFPRERVTKRRLIRNSVDYAPIFTFAELLRDDDRLVKYKRTNIAFDGYGAVPVILFQSSVFITRASLYKSIHLNIYFSFAFTISIVSIWTFIVLMCILLLERATNPALNSSSNEATNMSYQSSSSHSCTKKGLKVDLEKDQKDHAVFSSNKKNMSNGANYFAGTSPRMKAKLNSKTDLPERPSRVDSYRFLIPLPQLIMMNKMLQRMINHWVFQEAFDAMALTGSFAIGLYLLARVVHGKCKEGVTIFESQECNPVASAGSIPQDQLLMKRTRFRTILMSWAISTAFVCTAVVVTKSYLQIYSVLYSLYFLYIHYETERFLKISYVQNVMFLEAVFKQQKREKRHALEKANYEFEVEKSNEKNRVFLEINHLKIMMDNIAHNLRTPIQSINMGIELLQSEYASIIDEHRIINKKGSQSELPFDFLIRTISASCLFMTMAINRSVDFSKVNCNVGLVPTYETKKLLDVMSEPVDCIRTLQNSVVIKVRAIPDSVCAHVILDEMWVKESLLCLLSNSVKYSNGGVIHVDTELIHECEGIRNQDVFCDHNGIEMSGEPTGDSTKSEAVKASFIRITVVDNGVGVSAEKRGNIFQPLRPSKKASGGTESGTGLGLYSLLKRMEALKGSCGMRQRSDGKEGSVFWFCFPYRPDPAAEDFEKRECPNGLGAFSSFDTNINTSLEEMNAGTSKGATVIGSNNWAQRRLRTKKMSIFGSTVPTADNSTTQPSTPIGDTEIVVEASTSAKFEPLRILIIEDSITIILIVTKLLEKKGHIVESEKNGFSGLNRLKEVFNTKLDFDLVLLDVQMPVLDGFECVSRYRAFEVEQIKNLNNAALNKTKTDTLKLLLHSKYFRINYANNLHNNSFNMDNFKYTSGHMNQSEKVGIGNFENALLNSTFSNLPTRTEDIDMEPDIDYNSKDDAKDDGGSVYSNCQSVKSDLVLRRGNMAIVGMSANNDNESRILALRKGMNFFITKPFSNADLQNILNLFDC